MFKQIGFHGKGIQESVKAKDDEGERYQKCGDGDVKGDIFEEGDE